MKSSLFYSSMKRTIFLLLFFFSFLLCKGQNLSHIELFIGQYFSSEKINSLHQESSIYHIILENLDADESYKALMYLTPQKDTTLLLVDFYTCETELCSNTLLSYVLKNGIWKEQKSFMQYDSLQSYVTQRGFFDTLLSQSTFHQDLQFDIINDTTISITNIMIRYYGSSPKEIWYTARLFLKDGYWKLEEPTIPELTDKEWEKLEKQYDGLATISDSDGVTNIRTDKNTRSKIIGKVYFNETFLVRNSTSKWCEILTKTGTKGYIHQSRVSIID